jgi:hypothetical protein
MPHSKFFKKIPITSCQTLDNYRQKKAPDATGALKQVRGK